MARFSRLTAFVLMTVVVGVSSLPAQVLPINTPPHARPAGCHGHGSSKTPAHEPTNYKCCLAGHNAAVLQPLQSPQPIVPMAASEFPSQPSFGRKFPDGWKNRNVSSGDPPAATPLRI